MVWQTLTVESVSFTDDKHTNRMSPTATNVPGRKNIVTKAIVDMEVPSFLAASAIFCEASTASWVFSATFVEFSATSFDSRATSISFFATSVFASRSLCVRILRTPGIRAEAVSWYSLTVP
jgi:hypothetical protein